MDDIVKKIIDTPGEVYVSNIDVVRAFRNLRVDLVDALKFGIFGKASISLIKGLCLAGSTIPQRSI